MLGHRVEIATSYAGQKADLMIALHAWRSADAIRQFSDAFEPDVFKVLDVKTALRSRKAVGAPSPANVSRQISRWQKRLAGSNPL